MSDATPRPWRMRKGDPKSQRYAADVQGPGGQFVADCGSHESSDANAALIVRAVNHFDDLLAALDNIADGASRRGESESGHIARAVLYALRGEPAPEPPGGDAR